VAEPLFRSQGPDVRSADLTLALTQMSRVLLAAQTAATAVDLVGVLAVEAIHGAVGAGVTLVDRDGKRSRAASHPLVLEADGLQYEFDAGPCLTAWRERRPVRIADLTTEDRWPEWTAAAAALGVRSMVSVPMVTQDRAIGAIKVYAAEAGVFDNDTDRVLGLFADQAAVLLANTQSIAEARELSATLTEALDDRDVVAQATGIMLAQGAVDVEAGFVMLMAAAHQSGLTIHQVSRDLVDLVSTRNLTGSLS